MTYTRSFGSSNSPTIIIKVGYGRKIDEKERGGEIFNLKVKGEAHVQSWSNMEGKNQVVFLETQTNPTNAGQFTFIYHMKWWMRIKSIWDLVVGWEVKIDYTCIQCLAWQIKVMGPGIVTGGPMEWLGGTCCGPKSASRPTNSPARFCQTRSYPVLSEGWDCMSNQTLHFYLERSTWTLV